jgi:hypothetical protein
MPAQVEGTVELEVHLKPGRVKEDGDLSIAVGAFAFEINGARQTFAGTTSQAVTDNTTNYVFLNEAGAFTVQTSGWNDNVEIRLARVITSGGFITKIMEERVLLAAALDNELAFDSSNGVSSTTLTTWQEKLSVVTPSLPAGTYRVHWNLELKHSDDVDANFAEARLHWNDTTEIARCQNRLSRYDHRGGYSADALGAGVQQFDLDYRAQGGGTASVRRAKIMIERMGV